MTTLLETSHRPAQVPLALHATCPALYLACVGRLACDPPAPTPNRSDSVYLSTCLSVQPSSCLPFLRFLAGLCHCAAFATSFLLDCGLTRLHIHIICDGDEHPLTAITLRPKHQFVAGSRRQFVPHTCFLLFLPLRLIPRPL